MAIKQADGYCAARKAVDDNGNWFYVKLSDPFETEELVRDWMKYAGRDYDVIVPATQKRLLEP